MQTSQLSTPFIERHSVVKIIWADPDMVLLIFAGAAAEFALNRAVDWLFYTDSLPKDPIGRLFSTVRYAQRIVFASDGEAQRTLDSISSIHAAIESRRGQRIPDWAYRDVLYMLVDYSARAHRLLRGHLSPAHEETLYAGFLQIGRGLHIPELPGSFSEWRLDRQRHLEQDLVYSHFTESLLERYRSQLGEWRYQMLREIQALLTPAPVRELLRLKPNRLPVRSCLRGYSAIGNARLRTLVRRVMIPHEHWKALDQLTAFGIDR